MPESPKHQQPLKEEEEEEITTTSSSPPPQPEQNAWKVVGSPARRASLNPIDDDGKRVRAASFSAAATPFIPKSLGGGGRNAATIPPPGFHQETAVDWTPPVTPSIWANDGSPVVRERL
jgi:hypothetical protein